jgi:hypothetical protein
MTLDSYATSNAFSLLYSAIVWTGNIVVFIAIPVLSEICALFESLTINIKKKKVLKLKLVIKLIIIIQMR